MNEKKENQNLMERWKTQVKKLKKDTFALYLAIRDPRTPWYAKAFAGLVVAYAFSPIDLVPDFIPVLGYLDDLMLIPLGIFLSIRMIPSDVMEACRLEAETAFEDGKPVNRTAGVVIVMVWVLLAALGIRWLVAQRVR